MRALRAWLSIIKSVGSGARAGKQGGEIFRYFVFKALSDVGFLEYLAVPRTYGELIAEFGFEDGEYFQGLMNTLINDKQNLILQNNKQYARNHEVAIPDLETILRKTHHRVQPMMLMAEALSENIITRLRAERLGLPEVFERDEHRVVNMFNELLGTAFYSIVRAGCFDYLKRAERQWLTGKQLLEIGCGNGLETAEIWLLTKGKVHITAVDAVPGMLQLAEKQFDQYLDQIQPKHPMVTAENRPVFKLANATNLPFEDNSFDAVLCFFVLHWTANPAMAIKEAVRVVRPGGLIFGAQSYKPYTNPYLDLVVRSSRNSYGFFWKEDVHRWFADYGWELDMITPAGIFRARNTSE